MEKIQDKIARNSPFQGFRPMKEEKMLRILQLNIEGISRSKSECLMQIAVDQEADIIALQETHAEDEEAVLRRGTLSLLV